MYAFLMVIFIFLCFFLALFILIQQGKGDLGLSNLAGGQMLFGGSGGQEFFEKATWVMGALFIFGALGLSILKSKEDRASVLEGVIAEQKAQPQTAAPKVPASTPKQPESQPQAANADTPLAQQANTAASQTPAQDDVQEA